jgi:cyclin-dependent kinase-like
MIVYQMLKSVAFCHRRNVVHRDIKPENILVNEKKDYELKLCDFGFSRMIPNGYKGEPEYEGGKMTEYVATRWYRSPELLLGYTSYGPDVDLWAIGCMMAEMSDKEPLFPGDSEMDMLTLI